MGKKLKADDPLILEDIIDYLGVIDKQIRKLSRSINTLESYHSHNLIDRTDSKLIELDRRQMIMISNTEGWVAKTAKAMGDMLERALELERVLRIKEQRG